MEPTHTLARVAKDALCTSASCFTSCPSGRWSGGGGGGGGGGRRWSSPGADRAGAAAAVRAACQSATSRTWAWMYGGADWKDDTEPASLAAALAVSQFSRWCRAGGPGMASRNARSRRGATRES